MDTNQQSFLVELDLIQNPALVLENLRIIDHNNKLNNLLNPSNPIVINQDIDKCSLFYEDARFLSFLEKLKNQIEVADQYLLLWNKSPIFANSKVFERFGEKYTFITLTKFALSDVEDVVSLWGSRNYIKTLVDRFDFWVTVRDREGRIVLCNQSFEDFVGKQYDEIIGKTLPEIFGETEAVKEQIETDQQLFRREKEQVHLHQTLVDAKGRSHYIEVTKFPINFGNEEFVFCISIDASELDYIRQLYEESSTLYRALIENAFDAIYLMKGRHYVYVNPRFCELTGYTAEELTSEDFDFIVLLPEESRKYLEWRYQMRLEGKEIPNQYELELLHKSGKRVFVEVSTVSVGKPGEVLVMGIMRDITQRKIYEQQLRESEERLKELNAAKDKFFNIIAHDLRAPISGLISMTKTLIENSDILTPEETKELLTELLDYANQSFNLLENLLQWSRSQTGTIPFKPEDTDLYEIALSSVVINEPNAKQKGISISNLVPEGSISFVDRNMITTVVRNLISNAIKFTNPGGEIQISLKDNPDDYELIVADNGVGMDSEKLSKLFKIGENISTPGTAHEKGSGLGLILVKEFVEKNGGSIRVESEVGKGTRFFIKLPKRNKE